MKLFRRGRDACGPDAFPALHDLDDTADLPGHVFQAARSLTGLSQQDLRDASTVSKKVINDFENGFLRPKPALVERLAAALRDHGARFVRGGDAVGVVVVLTRARVEAISRSPARGAAEVPAVRTRAPAAPTTTPRTSAGIRPGRPRRSL